MVTNTESNLHVRISLVSLSVPAHKISIAVNCVQKWICWHVVDWRVAASSKYISCKVDSPFSYWSFRDGIILHVLMVACFSNPQTTITFTFRVEFLQILQDMLIGCWLPCLFHNIQHDIALGAFASIAPDFFYARLKHGGYDDRRWMSPWPHPITREFTPRSNWSFRLQLYRTAAEWDSRTFWPERVALSAGL